MEVIPDAAARVDRLCRQWGLTPEDHDAFGDWNLVCLVRRGDEPCVLRICGPGSDVDDEVAAWFAEAYAVGEQRHLERRAPRSSEG
jgi:hypothetical protein